MNPEELDKQFEAVDFDKSGNVIPPGSPPAAARKKRVTVADLMKLINELEELINTDIFNWMEKLDTRTNHLETLTNEMHPDFPKGVTSRLDKIEHELLPQSKQGAKFVWDRIDTLEAAIGALANAFRQHLDDISGEQPAAAQEIEFATPPEPPAAVSIRAGDIVAVASVCVSMGDVLMICRALRESPSMDAMDKNEILNIACTAAGVQPTHGLQIRAGVHERR